MDKIINIGISYPHSTTRDTYVDAHALLNNLQRLGFHNCEQVAAGRPRSTIKLGQIYPGKDRPMLSESGPCTDALWIGLGNPLDGRVHGEILRFAFLAFQYMTKILTQGESAYELPQIDLHEIHLIFESVTKQLPNPDWLWPSALSMSTQKTPFIQRFGVKALLLPDLQAVVSCFMHSPRQENVTLAIVEEGKLGQVNFENLAKVAARFIDALCNSLEVPIGSLSDQKVLDDVRAEIHH